MIGLEERLRIFSIFISFLFSASSNLYVLVQTNGSDALMQFELKVESVSEVGCSVFGNKGHAVSWISPLSFSQS